MEASSGEKQTAEQACSTSAHGAFWTGSSTLPRLHHSALNVPSNRLTKTSTAPFSTISRRGSSNVFFGTNPTAPLFSKSTCIPCSLDFSVRLLRTAGEDRRIYPNSLMALQASGTT